jgi:hypothetical protein
MTAMSAQPPRDRSVTLTLVGAWEVIVGLVMLLLALVMSAVMLALGPQTGLSPGMTLAATAFYLVVGPVLVAVGVACALGRRWGWALSRVAAGLWIAYAALVAVSLVVMAAAAAFSGRKDGPFEAFMFVVMGGVIGLLALPAVAVSIALREPDVRATVVARDPEASWTERRPLPVLALVVMLAIGVVFCVVAAFTYPFALGPLIVTGPAASAGYVALATIIALAARGAWSGSPFAWWLALALFVAGPVSMCALVAAGSLWDFYEAMGIGDQHLALMKSTQVEGQIVIGSIVASLAAIGFLVHLRPMFRKTA